MPNPAAPVLSPQGDAGAVLVRWMLAFALTARQKGNLSARLFLDHKRRNRRFRAAPLNLSGVGQTLRIRVASL